MRLFYCSQYAGLSHQVVEVAELIFRAYDVDEQVEGYAGQSNHQIFLGQSLVLAAIHKPDDYADQRDDERADGGKAAEGFVCCEPAACRSSSSAAAVSPYVDVGERPCTLLLILLLGLLLLVLILEGRGRKAHVSLVVIVTGGSVA